MTVTKPTWALHPTSKETGSFAGGTPYLAADERWPRDEEGHAWRFLLQVELKGVPDLGLNLPTEGYLQFFHMADPLFGMTLEDPADPSVGNQVFVRHVTNVADQGEHIPDDFLNGHDDDETPLDNPHRRTYYVGELVAMRPFENTLDFEEANREDDEGVFDFLQETFSSWKKDQENAEDDTVELPQEDYEFHLGGFPAFTQQDFRSDLENEVLLLGSESGKNIMWGDMGVAGYWLKPEDVDSQDYGKAYLYWDCF